MDDLSRAEFEARITMGRTFVKDSESRLNTVPNRFSALTNLAGKWASIARCSTHLGDRDNAQSAYRSYLKYVLEKISATPQGKPEGPDKTHALELALMCNAGEIEANITAKPLPATDRGLTKLGHAYYRSLRALCTNDIVEGGAAADEITQIGDVAAKRDKFYPSLGSAVQGILDRDTNATGQAIERILEQHVIYATKGGLRGLEAALICRPAVCLCILSSRVGIQLSIDNRFHSVEMSFPVTHLQEWQGKPTKGLKCEMRVDVLPIGILS